MEKSPTRWPDGVSNGSFHENGPCRSYPSTALVFPAQASHGRFSSGVGGPLNPDTLPGSLESMAMDLGVVDFAYKPDESWLLGEDFDLTALGSSIYTSGAPWNITLQDVKNSVGTGGSTNIPIQNEGVWARVRDRWYSRPTLEGTPTHQISGRQEYQDKVDETYRAGLSNRLRPQLYDSALPSAGFLVCTLPFFTTCQSFL